jgi:Fe-S oxidoreductase/FAD/FMN-containing dehydrogenase
VDESQRKSLQEKFGSRVSFDRLECRLYGHDIGAMPSLVKPIVGRTVPEAVVQPRTELELADLVHWANEHHIPLTPRGKASSGYGGVLAVDGGVVVDFWRMKDVIRIDPAAQTATVQPGIVWEDLDGELQKHGLMLRLYPTSYPSSTVGGWLAQGGAGIGSFESGWFSDNVLSARVVLPDGAVREFSGPDLDLVADAEGITGLISEVTIRVQPLEELKVVAISSADAPSLQRLMEGLVERKLPIWSVVFINPYMAELKNKAPLRQHKGKPAEKRVALPETYIIMLTFRKRDANTIMQQLPQLLEATASTLLSDEIAQHEWEERFKLMVVKRLGPSLVPAEVVVPLSALAQVLGEVEHKVHKPVVKEGVVVWHGSATEPEAVILGFIPADQRSFGYNFVFPLSLSILKVAEHHGGRPYATGLYFARKADRVLGTERVQRLKAFKAQNDPNDILNPGKVVGRRFIATALTWAESLEPVIRPLGNRTLTRVAERPTKAVRGIPADVAWYAYSCSQCGYCVGECDQFYGRGWESQSPRGKWYWLQQYMEGREKWNQFMVDAILACTTCELCNVRCSTSLPIEPAWMKLRGDLIEEQKRMTFPPFELMGAALHSQGDIWAGYRRDRSNWFPQDLWEKHGPRHTARVVYFAGCTASYVEKDIGIATVRLLNDAGVDFTYLGPKESCCGTPMLVAGKWELFAETMKRNIDAAREAGANTVVCSCPACDMMWRQVYPEWCKKLGIEYGIQVKHYSEVLAEKIQAGEFAFPPSEGSPVTVTWHDSCHIGRASGVYDAPRQLIKAIPNVTLVEMDHNRESAHCCGSVLTLIKEPAVAAEVGKIRLDEAIEAGAQQVLALCPCCEVQFRVTVDKKHLPLEVVDLAHFAARALGYPIPDPNPEVQKQWAVFEAMIELMTPQGFADLMGTMWPELVDAMPLGMGAMMRIMGRVPGALELMRPFFPVLFPLLLPGIMPKVMPTMLSQVAQRIPMPDYMLEQMPELMPQVMASLMPHMIGDVVPLVTQPLIDYLRSKGETMQETQSPRANVPGTHG